MLTGNAGEALALTFGIRPVRCPQPIRILRPAVGGGTGANDRRPVTSVENHQILGRGLAVTPRHELVLHLLALPQVRRPARSTAEM